MLFDPGALGQGLLPKYLLPPALAPAIILPGETSSRAFTQEHHYDVLRDRAKRHGSQDFFYKLVGMFPWHCRTWG